MVSVYGHKNPIEVYIACWEWGKYLGEEALTEGVDVCVSSWNRMAPNTFPAMAKATGNYLNSALIKMEAITNGYTEGIALDNAGRISEGSGENIFLVYGGRILTPPLAGTILPGITRDSVLTIARDAGYRGYLPIETLPVGKEEYDPRARVQEAVKELRAALAEAEK